MAKKKQSLPKLFFRQKKRPTGYPDRAFVFAESYLDSTSAETLLEAIHSTTSVEDLLLTRVEWVAL